MSDAIVKALLDALTSEQKEELVRSLLTDRKVDQKTEQKREEVVSSKPRSNITEDFKVVNNSELEKRKSAVRAKKNEWVDTGEDRDPDFDPQRFERMGKTARSRGKVKKRQMECHVCGRSFQINPAFVHGEFIRCNRCTGR